MQIDFGLCENFTFEKLDSKNVWSGRGSAEEQQAAPSGVVIGAAAAELAGFVLLISVVRYVLPEIDTHFMLGAIGSLR